MALVEAAKDSLGVVQDGRSYLDNLANKYVVKPKTAQGIGGFVFDYEGDTTVRLHADITDHYAEDNSAIQDHVAVNPTRLTLRGFVGEVVLKAPTGIVGALNAVQTRLTQVPAYLGKYTPGAVQKIAAVVTSTQRVVNTIDQSLARVKNVVGLFDKSVLGRSKQEQAYYKLQALFVTHQVVIVATPYGTLNNMCIEDVIFFQDEKTKEWSDITVIMKQLRFVTVQNANLDLRAGRNAQQAQTQTPNGTTKGVPANISAAYRLAGFN